MPGKSAISMTVTGVQEAMTAISEKLKEKDKAVSRGLLAGGLLIQRDAQQHVPVEYGKLRASAYTRLTPEDDHKVEIGFSAVYALWVHENIEVHAGEPRRSGLGVVWGPNGEPKFLENAAVRQRDAVVSIVHEYAMAGATGGEVGGGEE